MVNVMGNLAILGSVLKGQDIVSLSGKWLVAGDVNGHWKRNVILRILSIIRGEFPVHVIEIVKLFTICFVYQQNELWFHQ